MSVLLIVLTNIATVIHMCCTYLISNYFRRKALGMQTWKDLITMNLLIVQCTDIFVHVMLYNWWLSSKQPAHEFVGIFIAFIVNGRIYLNFYFKNKRGVPIQSSLHLLRNFKETKVVLF